MKVRNAHMAAIILDLQRKLAAVETEREEYEKTADENEDHLRVLTDANQSLRIRAEAAEARVKELEAELKETEPKIQALLEAARMARDGLAALTALFPTEDEHPTIGVLDNALAPFSKVKA
jgi:septal ring factor EnvC (AmiA/AmiB activator)